MNLIRQLTEKPWVPAQARIDDRHRGGTFRLPAKTVALRTFLAVVTVLFTLLVLSYGTRMEFEDWRPTPPLRLLWLNTGLLVLSSLAMQWAEVSARRGEIDGVRNGLLAGGACAVAFLGGQILAWRQLNMLAVFDVANPAIAFFFLITALHGLHLLGGLVAWGRTTAKAWRGSDVAQVRLSVELCTVYWHFLLLVWLVLFGLLFSGNDNLGVLLALCGLR
ncbi:cytochrome c oxidase subunit 3 [Taklimakanibacter deserti]|uniref:cytochrome c oxidase subunit 3 n=1 Tax=Taklimakanibacter deserti TaxID=2267839 RepID=UPI000E64C6F8